MTDEETYLGDGLYASRYAGLIQLRAPREDGDHVIFLEPETYAALKEFARKIGWEPEK
jgi:hypothetical protein